jgi:hypothetical protein
MNLESVRRSLSLLGLTPAFAVPESARGRAEEASIAPARLIEGPQLRAFAVAGDEAWPDPVAYLDGIQRSELVGYLGSSPLVIADISAAVRERHSRKLRTVLEERRRLALGRPPVLKAAGGALAGMELVHLPDQEPPHPLRDLVNAGRALDRSRGLLEILVGNAYRARSDAWLVIDGVLSESPGWAADPRMIAISKGHSMLPFDGSDLEQYLRMPAAHRSSIYAPATRSLAPVCSWGLRLWPWEGHDLLHGLVRVEVAPENGTTEAANLISRWILADRAPISAPDRRWDRLLYGIYSVEEYLKSRVG